MSRILTVTSALAFALLGGASAQGERSARPCPGCGPIGTTHYIRTIHPTLDVTRYHDRSVVDRVTRVRHVVDVTRIQPIIHIHDITRVHHLTLVSVREAYAYPAPSWTPVAYPQLGAGITAGCSCAGDE